MLLAAAIVAQVARTRGERPGARAAEPDVPPAPTGLPAIIQTDRGPMLLELQYIPGVVDCELAHFTEAPAALDAQAIAARTYLARALVARGAGYQVPTGPKFQCWRRPKHVRSVMAAQRTAGRIARWRGLAINGNYVAGVRELDDDCRPTYEPTALGYPHATWAEMRAAWLNGQRYRGPAYTQIFVTYNAGRRGPMVRETRLGNFGAPNRGALSQHGAICLAERRGLDAAGILRFFYGEDLEL